LHAYFLPFEMMAFKL